MRRPRCMNAATVDEMYATNSCHEEAYESGQNYD